MRQCWFVHTHVIFETLDEKSSRNICLLANNNVWHEFPCAHPFTSPALMHGWNYQRLPSAIIDDDHDGEHDVDESWNIKNCSRILPDSAENSQLLNNYDWLLFPVCEQGPATCYYLSSLCAKQLVLIWTDRPQSTLYVTIIIIRLLIYWKMKARIEREKKQQLNGNRERKRSGRNVWGKHISVWFCEKECIWRSHVKNFIIL